MYKRQGTAPTPIFGPYLLRSNGCMHQDATRHGARPRPLPYTKRGRSPQFSAHVYCVKTAGWIKMVLGVEVGLSPGDFVLDGNPSPLPKKGAEPPKFAHVYCGQTVTWIKMPLGTEAGVGPDDIFRWGPSSSLPKKAAQPPPNFWRMCIVVKRLDGSRWHLAWRWALFQATLC